METIKDMKAGKGFIEWLNKFQETNCRGCRYAIWGPVGVGELCCEFFATEVDNGKCLTREDKEIDNADQT